MVVCARMVDKRCATSNLRAIEAAGCSFGPLSAHHQKLPAQHASTRVAREHAGTANAASAHDDNRSGAIDSDTGGEMPATHESRTTRWISNDKAEAVVRGLLVSGHLFENEWFDVSERGETLPRMRATIPGQYNSTNGIDIFAIDWEDNLWIIEVTRGNERDDRGRRSAI